MTRCSPIALLLAVACSTPEPPPDPTTPVTEPEPTTPAPTEPTEPTGPTGEIVLTVEVQSAGVVPAAGATVTLGDDTTHPVVDGEVVLTGLDAGVHVLQVEAEGFVEASVPVTLHEGRLHHLTVALLPWGTTTTFDASQPMHLQHEGATVDLPASAFVDGAGQPVEGLVTAHVTAFDALESHTLFPGSMTTDDQGTLEILNSFGMVDVTVEGPKGERLQLAPDARARLSFALPEGRTRVGASNEIIGVGSVIPAWSYDPTSGQWTHEGIGFVTRNDHLGRLEWTFEAPHFSWWNSDDNIIGLTDTTCVLASLEYEDGTPVEDPWRAVVRGVDWGGQMQPRSEIDGAKCIEAPQNALAVLYLGREQPETFWEFDTDDSAYRCEEAARFGCPYEHTAVVPNPSCLRGRVLVDGYGRADVLVTAVADYGQWQTTTDSQGEYCVKVPNQTPFEVRASLLGDDGRFNDAAAELQTDAEARRCSDGNCLVADDLELTEEDIFCIAGRIEAQTELFGKAVGPLAQGTVFHVFGDDFTPTHPQGGVPPQSWQADYVISGVVGADGSYCVDLPVESGNFEIVVDATVADPGLCGSELSPPVCHANSEVLSAVADSTDYRGLRCRVNPSVCKRIDVFYDED